MPVGDYCERTVSGLWGEPYNAVSNLAFLVVAVDALRMRRGVSRYGTWLLWAAGVFAVSLTARTLDRPLCTDIPIGTHFVWHILNAVVLFTVGYAVVDRYRRGSGPRARPAGPGDHDWIVRTLTAEWGSTTAVAHGVAYDAGTLPALVAEAGGERAGLLTYVIEGGALEVVALDAPVHRSGAGTALLAAASDVARAAGAGRLWLVTTNDNLDALRFYQRRGMRIVGVTPGGVDASRLLKPSIPTVGAYGIPLRDELTLELVF